MYISGSPEQIDRVSLNPLKVSIVRQGKNKHVFRESHIFPGLVVFWYFLRKKWNIENCCVLNCYLAVNCPKLTFQPILALFQRGSTSTTGIKLPPTPHQFSPCRIWFIFHLNQLQRRIRDFLQKMTILCLATENFHNGVSYMSHYIFFWQKGVAPTYPPTQYATG